MTYYVTQFGNSFFSIRRVSGYAGNMLFKGTKLTESEYKKLFYSSSKRTITKCGRFDEVRIEGIAADIIGKDTDVF